jgi:F-type H+-transporting ATPase subunit gamma
MSQLIRLRQRLKAIETIKKITSAMRIISRSLHTRMNKQKGNLQDYQEQIKHLFEKLHQFNPDWKSDFFFPSDKKYSKKLYIIIGSQKGLCGSYNTELTYWLKQNKELLAQRNTDIAVVGKRTFDAVSDCNLKIIKELKELKTKSLESLTHDILELIKFAKPVYTEIILVSSLPENFFTHRLQKQVLLPFKDQTPIKNDDDYLWQHEPDLILDQLADMYLKSLIYNSLFFSLLGEQAARFIAMDNATRNANSFIDSMQLQYNKMRQAKITRELTELSANFQN